MKGISKNKRGISLIVLVITIIVMIILASAIILSLRSSGIIGRANEAKTKSDIANAKEVVSLAYAEWELDKANIGGTFSEYAMTKLQEAGFDTEDMYVTEEGELYTGAAAFFTKNNIAIGTEVTGYTLNNTTSYTTDGTENEADEEGNSTDPQPATITRDDNITWKYFGIDENGEALIVADVTSSMPKVSLGGKGGYLNGPKVLNTICEMMYSSDMGTARSIDINDVTRVLEYTGEKGAYYDIDNNYIPTLTAKEIGQIAVEKKYEIDYNWAATIKEGDDISKYLSDMYIIYKNNDANEYNIEMQDIIYSNNSISYWLASPCIYASFGYPGAVYSLRFVDTSSVSTKGLDDSNGCPMRYTYTLRPVVKLAYDVIASYNGTTVTLSK